MTDDFNWHKTPRLTSIYSKGLTVKRYTVYIYKNIKPYLHTGFCSNLSGGVETLQSGVEKLLGLACGFYPAIDVNAFKTKREKKNTELTSNRISVYVLYSTTKR
jgi:hypothetical protein